MNEDFEHSDEEPIELGIPDLSDKSEPSEQPDVPNSSKANEEEFLAMVRDYHKAVEEEFDSISTGDVDALMLVIRKKVQAKLLTLTNSLLDLATDADSESTRLQAQKFCFQLGLGDLEKVAKSNPLESLLARMAND